MSQTTKTVLSILGVLAAAWFAYHIVIWALPFIIIAAVVYGAYQIFGRRALSGGRRTLP